MSKFDQCYLRWRGKTSGPFTWAEIERKLDSHEIGLLHDLQQNNEWTTLGEYLGGRGDTPRVPPALPITATNLSANVAPAAATGQKLVRIPSRWIFVALGLLVGFAGLHDFYAHHYFRGAIIFLIAGILWFLDWGIVWPWLYALGEIIFTKLDGQGRRMPWKRK